MIGSASSMLAILSGATAGIVHSSIVLTKMPPRIKKSKRDLFTGRSYSGFGYLGDMKFSSFLLLGVFALGCNTPEVQKVESVDTTATVTADDKILDIQERLRAGSEPSIDEPTYRIDQERFAPFRKADGTIDLRGRSVDEIRSALGEPFTSKHSGSKSVLLYRVYPDDSTALYLFVNGSVVERFRLDEFNGWEGSSALSWFTF